MFIQTKRGIVGLVITSKALDTLIVLAERFGREGKIALKFLQRDWLFSLLNFVLVSLL